MGYRLPPPTDGLAHIDATATESVISVDNGAITWLSFPCHYCNGEVTTWLDVMRIDHAGWPSPDSPDCSWQPDDVHGNEIDLAGEGYDTVTMCIQSDVDGIEVEGAIDGSIVRVRVSAFVYEAQSEDIEFPFSIIIYSSDMDALPMASIVTKGTLRIEKAFIGMSDPDEDLVPDTP